MNRLYREVTVQRDELETWFKNILGQLNADLYDYSTTAAETLLSQYDNEYYTMRRHIAQVLIEALSDDIDCVATLLEKLDDQ